MLDLDTRRHPAADASQNLVDPLAHRPFPRAEIEQSLYARFAEQVRRHPDRLAICSPRCRWTYAELAARVDGLAALLLQHCGPERGRVALMFEHDAPMIAGMLAALRAGKVYVPLDPGYPVARLTLMIDDCRPQAVFAQAACMALARQLGRANLPIVEASLDGSLPAAVAYPETAPHDPAYILYTSGSTGRPKGVLQNQRNVLHFIRAYTNNLQLSASDRLSMLSSYSFDAAVMSTYGALLNGACLVPRSAQELGFRGIVRWIDEEQLTIYHSTPTVFRNVIEACAPDQRFASVRRVVMGGEPVVRRDVERFKRHFTRDALMVNGLGPTESTVTLQCFIDHDTDLTANTVPVGRPVCDTEIRLLDAQGEPALDEGELVFVSEHIALGYFEKPELTAAAFADLPDGRRSYRSGDLARWRPDGLLEFLGRRDHQIKRHGVRIELGDIEAAIERQPEVSTAIVVVLPDGPRGADAADERQLVAAVRLRAAARLETRALQATLAAELPAAMRPNRIVLLDDLPTTPTGKIDRIAVAERVAALLPADGTRPVAALRSDTERALAAVWQAVIGHPPADTDEDFFDVGGDSLGAVRLCDGVERAFGRRLALGRLLGLRRFSALVRALDGRADLGRSEAMLIDLSAPGATGPSSVYCLCGVELYRPLAQAIGSPHRVAGVFLPIEDRSPDELRHIALEDMARQYGEVIRAHDPVGPYRLVGVSFGGMLAFELARQLRAAGASVDFVGIFDTYLPQTLTRAHRLRTHAHLALRHGAGYLASRLGPMPAEGPSGLDAPDADPDAEAERGQVYDDALRRYRARMPRYEGDVHFFRATDCSDFEREAYPLDCHWSRFVGGRLVVTEVHGAHLTMLAPPHVGTLGRMVRRALDRLAGRVTAPAAAG